MYSTFRWSASIGNKFFHVVPGATVAVILATLVSQFSIVLASLLPLKVVMLLGSNNIPRYFPDFFSSVNRDSLIVILSLLAIGFYLLHLCAEKVIVHGADRGALVLLEKSQKMALFENQEDIASRGYQRYSRSLASIILLIFISAGIFLLYFDLFLVLLGYVLVAFLFLISMYSVSRKAKLELEEKPGKIVSTATNVGFLLAFGFMVVQFLWGDPPGLIIAIVSLILMRQGFSRVTGLVNDIKGLYSQKLKLNSLFFHGHAFVDEIKKHETSFWSLFHSPFFERWVGDVLKGVCEHPVNTLSTEWFQLGVQDVVAFRVRVVGDDGKLFGEYLIKVFNSNKSALAKHEATLLSSEQDFPALQLVGVDEVDGMHCHVFEWCLSEKITLDELKPAKRMLMGALMGVEPSGMLVSLFNRSRQPLWQRLDHKMYDRLMTVAHMMGAEEVAKVERLFSQRDSIANRIRKLPLSFFIPDIGVDAVLKKNDESLLLVHWARWSLEPVGAGWPVHYQQLENLSEDFIDAREKREALHGVEEKNIHLAALVFELERLYSRQQFSLAFKLIPEILACVESAPEGTLLAESKA